MRRKPGALLPIELSILDAGIALSRQGTAEFHGYLIAAEMREHDGARRLTAHGTLYKALGRMETAGTLESHWEDPQIAAEDARPRRRLYHVTAAGEQALAKALEGLAAAPAAPTQRRPTTS